MGREPGPTWDASLVKWEKLRKSDKSAVGSYGGGQGEGRKQILGAVQIEE